MCIHSIELPFWLLVADTIMYLLATEKLYHHRNWHDACRRCDPDLTTMGTASHLFFGLDFCPCGVAAAIAVVALVLHDWIALVA